jgi:pimeloyl-ACP methyl ester carboxylesterase
MMRPILLLHGLFGSLSDPAILAPFGQSTVFAPDLIGYGVNRDDARLDWTLEDQADHVKTWVRGVIDEPVHVVGHSVGGAVGVLFASRYPEMIASLTSVEGNFTLGDAFWSQKISTMGLPEIKAEVDVFRSDLSAWLARSGVPSTTWTLAAARSILDNQSEATLRSQARAVVTATGAANYLEIVRNLLARGLPIHLVAGARSRAGWSVPDWVAQQAASNNDIAEAGHLMMLEKPELFAQTLIGNFAS